MAASRRGIEIPLRIRPDSSVQRALRGVTKSARQATLQEIADAKRAADQKVRIEERTQKERSNAAARGLRMQMVMMSKEAREVERLARLKVKEDERALRDRARAHAAFNRFVERQHREQVRSESRSNDARAASARKLYREYSRAAANAQKEHRQLVVGIAGGVGSGAAYLASRAGAFGGTLGAQSPEQLLAQRLEMQRASIRVANQAGMNDKQRGEMEAAAVATSAKYGISATSIMEGLATQQSQFSELGGAAVLIPQLDKLAEAAVATNTDFNDLVRTMGVTRRQYKLTAEKSDEALGMIIDSANRGNIEVANLSNEMVSAIAALGRGANLGGLPGLGKALGLTQALGASDLSPAEAATRGVNFVTALNKPEVRQGLRQQFRVDVDNADGSLRDIPTILEELSKAGFGTSQKGQRRTKAIGDVQGREAFEILVKQFEGNRALFTSLVEPDANAGHAYVAKTSSELLAGTGGDALTLAARQYQAFHNSPEVEKFTKLAVDGADGLASLTAEFPLLTEAVKATTVALGGLAAGLVAQGVLGGKGAGAIPTAALGGGPATLAKGAGRFSRFAGAAGNTLAVLGAGIGAYEATSALVDAVPGERGRLDGFGKFAYDATHGTLEMPRAELRPFAPRVIADSSGRGPSLDGDAPNANANLASTIEAAIARGMHGKATLKIEITEGKARVQSVTQTDSFPSVDTGGLTSRL